MSSNRVVRGRTDAPITLAVVKPILFVRCDAVDTFGLAPDAVRSSGAGGAAVGQHGRGLRPAGPRGRGRRGAVRQHLQRGARRRAAVHQGGPRGHAGGDGPADPVPGGVLRRAGPGVVARRRGRQGPEPRGGVRGRAARSGRGRRSPARPLPRRGHGLPVAHGHVRAARRRHAARDRRPSAQPGVPRRRTHVGRAVALRDRPARARVLAGHVQPRG